MVPAERIELPTLALQKPCTSAVLRRSEIDKRPGSFRPTRNTRCLKPPFAAPPKETGTGQRDRLMSLGATIPYSKFTSCSRARAATMRLRSVEVVEIDAASPGLGQAAANHGGRTPGASTPV